MAGSLLLLEAIALCLVCLVLPRVHRQIKQVLGEVPTGMGGFAESLIPGFEVGMRFLKLVPRIVPLLAGFALCLGILGMIGLLFSPAWLNGIAVVSLLPFALLGAILFRLGKKYAPTLKQLLKAKDALRF